MTLAMIIGSLVATAMLTFVSFACFAYIYREYRRRRQLHLVSFSGAFFMMGLLALVSFIHQASSYGEYQSLALVSYRLFLIAATVVPFLMLDGLLRILDSRLNKARWPTILFVSIWMLMLVSVFSQTRGTTSQEFGFVHNGLLTNTIMLSGWVLLTAGLVWLAIKLRHQAKHLRWAIAALVSLLIAVGAGSISTFHLSSYLSILMAVAWIIFLGSLALVAAAGLHDDQRVALDPFFLVKRSLSLKVAITQVSVLALLLLALMVATVVYFVSQELGHRRNSLRQQSVAAADCIARHQERLLQVAQVFAMPPRQLPGANELNDRFSQDIGQLLSVTGSRLVRVTDLEGKLLYDNRNIESAGRSYARLAAVQGAIAGIPTVRYEYDPGYGRQVLVAAVPAALADNRDGVLVLAVDIDGCLQRNKRLASATIGCGTVDIQGQVIASAGLETPGSIIEDQLPVGGNQSSALLQDSHGGLISLEPIVDSSGVAAAYAYAFLPGHTLQSSVVRLSVIVILMSMLALMLVTVMLLSILALILLPIRQLRQASVAVEEGDYQVPISTGREDELGQLSKAFEHMRVTISRQTKKMQQHIQEQADFMVNTAHEMRTPLNVFSWTTDMMRYGDTGRMNKQQLELVEQLRQTTQRLFGLVQNMSDAAKLQRGDFTVDLEPCQLNDILDQAAGNVTIQANDRSVRLNWARPEDDPPPVLADRDRTYQILLNLLTNALKYTMPGGRVTLRLKRVGQQSPGGRKGDYLQVSVEDTGIGIPEEQQSRIFSRFFRARNAVASDTQGAGLGLYLTKKLVEIQSGRIWFESTENRGSVFSFTLPIAESSEEGNRPKASSGGNQGKTTDSD